jgi:tetratricopeptide (TPR) repeat protein
MSPAQGDIMGPHLSPEAMRKLLAGELTAPEESAGEAHLRACLACRAELDRLTATRPPLPALFAPPAAGAPSPPAAPPGYEVLGQLGLGRTAAVYRARQPGLGRVVALKVLSGGWPTEEESRRRFRAEIEAAACQDHPGVVRVFEVGSHQGRPFLLMEYCPGGSLAERLRGGPLAPRGAAELVEALARTVHAVHATGLVHRDLKPGNVLFDGSGRPKVADFGLAKRLGAADVPTPVGSVLGTPPYLAPEQIDGSSPAGPACDVYALGAILYECLAGRPPFRSEAVADILFDVLTREPPPPRLFDPRLPRDLETVCLKCLEKEPARRYATARELADDLRRFLDGRAVAARRVGPAGRAWRWGRRDPAPALLAMALALTLLAAAAACGRLWYQAVESGHQAEAARREAEENFLRARRLLPDLVAAGNGPWQQVAERRRARRESLERARGLYEELRRARPRDRALCGELAEVVTALAEVALSEGRCEAARDIALQALGLWADLGDEAQAEPRWRARRADALSHLATAQGLLGNTAEMTAAFRQAIAVYQSLADERPDDAGRLLAAVGARVNLAGGLLGEGRTDEWLSLSEENRRRLGAYLDGGRDCPAVSLGLAHTLWRLGERYELRGDAEGAARCWREGRARGEGLALALPNDPNAWFFPTACACQLPRGDPGALADEEAIRRLERAAHLCDASLALDPDGGTGAELLALITRCLAECYFGAGRQADALSAERRAAELVPSRPAGSLALELERLAGIARVARRERQVNEVEAALRHARDVADGFAAFCTTHAGDPRALAMAVDFSPRLTAPLRHAGGHDQSLRVAEVALRLTDQLAGPAPGAAHWRRLSAVRTEFGKCRWGDDPAGAEAALAEAAAAARRLVALVPEDRSVLDDRLRRLGRFLGEHGRRPEAAACLRERERLWPDNADGLRGVARGFRGLAGDVGRGRAALSASEQEEQQRCLAEAARLESAASALPRPN